MRVTTNPVTKAPVNLHPPSRFRHLEAKIAELNKKICRACNGRNNRRLIVHQDALRAELKWGPVQQEGAFSGAYRHYRIDGLPGVGPDTFFSRVKGFLVDLLK